LSEANLVSKRNLLTALVRFGASFSLVTSCSLEFDASRLDVPPAGAGGESGSGGNPGGAGTGGEAIAGADAKGGESAGGEGGAGGENTGGAGGESCGCYEDSFCLPGTSENACGKGGDECSICEGTTSACDAGRCVVPNAVVSLRAAGTHTLALDRNGAVWLFGHNAGGLFGEGATVGAEFGATRLDLPPLLDASSQGDTADAHACSVSPELGLACWGTGAGYQLGTGNVDDSSSPIPLVVADGPSAWTSVRAGATATLALGEDHTLWSWGTNDGGVLGLGPVQDAPEPTQITQPDYDDWEFVALRYGHACAIRGAEQTLYCWGWNDHYNLGRQGQAQGEGAFEPVPAPVDDEPNLWKSVDVGWQHSCGVRKNGSLWCWGNASDGRLGFASAVDVQAPELVDDQNEWDHVACGQLHTCGVRSDHTLWCWGDNEFGQLGSTESLETSEPLQVGTEREWSRVDTGFLHTCAAALDGSLWCWGETEHWRAGVSPQSTANVPTLIELSE
jgi:alpha-tubulin suppressor-like RCC1 family protein